MRNISVTSRDVFSLCRLSCSVLAARWGIWGACTAVRTAKACWRFKATQGTACSFSRSHPNSERSRKDMRPYPLVHASACPESPERCVLLDFDEHGGKKLSGLGEGIGWIETSALAMRTI